MKNSLVSDLSYVLCELRGMKTLLRVGLERSSTEGGIDLLAGCDDGSIKKYFPSIKALLENRWPTGNFFVCDDSIRFDLPTGSGGIAVYDSALLVKQVEEWVDGRNLEGQHRSWAIGYWLPEALCGDLATAETLHDVTDISTQLKKLLVPYPVSLSKSIVEFCINEIKQKLFLTYQKLPEDASIERELCLFDAAISMIRLAFARSRRYLRGFRSLEQQAKLLSPEDLLIYELALQLSKRKRVKDVVSKIKRLF